MYLIPVLVFVVLAVFLIRRLQLIGEGDAPELIHSVMIGKPMPDFVLRNLYADKPDVTAAALKTHVTLINIFASWCLPCREEHSNLKEIKKAGINLVGIDYEDKPETARDWLTTMGNPYDAVGSDMNGRTAIDFGSYGVPESYLVDKQGIIRFKQVGVLTPDIIEKQVVPLARELNR